MAAEQSKRVTIEQQNGITVYSAGFWPGWYEPIALSVILVVVSGAFAFLMWAFYGFRRVLNEAVDPGWLHSVLSFVIGGVFDITLFAGLAFLCLWIPYFLIYQLSPKQFWIENDTLFHTARLFGFIPHRRKIPFKQILDVQADESNGRHAVTVLYERTLPKWLFIVLVHWNEKFTQWSMTLINGIPTMAEAQQIQNALLEPMTASPVCRVGS